MKKTIEIPVITLNALKGLLFNDNGNVDLTPIINDLSVGLNEEQKDLTAIHVALTMKGLKPEVKVNPILYYGDWRQVRVYVYQGFSLIHGVAAFKVFNVCWRKEGWKYVNDPHNEVMGLEQIDETLVKTIAELKMNGIKEDESPNYDELIKIVEEIKVIGDCQ